MRGAIESNDREKPSPPVTPVYLVRRNPREPPAEARRVCEVWKSGKGREERLLNDIVGFGRVAQQPPPEGFHELCVLSEDGLLCPTITRK